MNEEYQPDFREREAEGRDRRPARPGRAKNASLYSALFEGRYEQAFQSARALREDRGESTPAGVLYAGACALFGLGHILQAEEWVEAHGELTKYRAEHLYLAAYIELHKGRADRALLYWTRIVQDDPSETFADELIEKLKRGEQRVKSELNQPGAFVRYVPLEPVDSKTRGSGNPVGVGDSRGRAAAQGERTRDAFWWLLAGIVLISVLSVGFGAYLDEILGLFAPDPYSAVQEDLPDVPAGGSVIRPDAYSDEAPRFIYPDKAAALAEYREAREKIGAGYPNQARYLLGRLELSNASFEIKERALLLRDAIPRVGVRDFRDPLDVASVLEEPYIYRDAQIDWRGRVAAPRASDAGVGFELILPRGESGAIAEAAPIDPAQSDPAADSADETGDATESAPGSSATVQVGVLFMAQQTEGGGAPPDLEAGQVVRVFGSVVKTSGGRITVHATEIIQ